MTEASTWTALRNAAFRRLWIANVISGSAIAAHGTAAFWVLDSLAKSNATFVIPLMATFSSLPFSLFTLPAGAIADLADRKKMLCGVSAWQATVAIGLAVLGVMHLLSPFVILASAFLFGAGFAFGSPASSAVTAEMVPAKDLPGANNLGVLQRNIDPADWSKLGFCLERSRFPAGFIGHRVVETGKATIAASSGKLFRVLYHRGPLRPVYSRHEDHFGAKRATIILHFYHLGVDAGGGSGGASSGACQPGISVYEYGHWLGHHFSFYSSTSTVQVFAATVDYVCRRLVDRGVHPDGYHSLVENVPDRCGSGRCRIYLVIYRALDSGSACHARLGAGAHECDDDHSLTRSNGAWKLNLGNRGC